MMRHGDKRRMPAVNGNLVRVILVRSGWTAIDVVGIMPRDVEYEVEP